MALQEKSPTFTTSLTSLLIPRPSEFSRIAGILVVLLRRYPRFFRRQRKLLLNVNGPHFTKWGQCSAKSEDRKEPMMASTDPCCPFPTSFFHGRADCKVELTVAFCCLPPSLFSYSSCRARSRGHPVRVRLSAAKGGANRVFLRFELTRCS